MGGRRWETDRILDCSSRGVLGAVARPKPSLCVASRRCRHQGAPLHSSGARPCAARGEPRPGKRHRRGVAMESAVTMGSGCFGALPSTVRFYSAAQGALAVEAFHQEWRCQPLIHQQRYKPHQAAAPPNRGRAGCRRPEAGGRQPRPPMLQTRLDRCPSGTAIRPTISAPAPHTLFMPLGRARDPYRCRPRASVTRPGRDCGLPLTGAGRQRSAPSLQNNWKKHLT